MDCGGYELQKVSLASRINDHEPREIKAWRSISDTYRTVYSHINSDLRRYGLTPPQYAVLRIIGGAKNEGMAMNEIGKKMIVTFANITTIVDNLEKRNYVKRVRNLTDRRVVQVRITTSGSNLFKNIFHAHRREIAKLMKILNPHELDNLILYSSKIRKHVLEM